MREPTVHMDGSSPTPAPSGGSSGSSDSLPPTPAGGGADHPDKDRRIGQLEHALASTEAAARRGEEAAQAREAALRAEVAGLRRQVHDLKAWVSTSTRATAAAAVLPTLASDDELAEALVRLSHGLQNWVLTHFRRAAFTAGSTAFAQLVPVDGDGDGEGGLAATARLPLLQSAAARVLVDDVFAAYFVGLPPADAALLAQTEARLRTYAPPDAVRQWRAQTVSLVAADAAQQLAPETARVTDAVVARITRVLDDVTLQPATTAAASAASATRGHGLRQLVASAIALARVLTAQRAEYELFMPTVQPHQQLLLDPSTMENIGANDDDSDQDDGGDAHAAGLPRRRHEVACVVFPGLIKRGDETGRHVQQYTNVLCRARVLCAWVES